MNKFITLDDMVYEITDQKNYAKDEELLFEIKTEQGLSYVVGLWDDLLGAPVRRIWKVVGKSNKD